MLDKDAILSRKKLKREKVKAYDSEVWVQELTGTDRDAFEMKVVAARDENGNVKLENLRACLAAMTMVDDDGERLFADCDVAQLGKTSGAELDKVFVVAQRLSALTDADVDELAGNSEAATNDKTGSS